MVGDLCIPVQLHAFGCCIVGIGGIKVVRDLCIPLQLHAFGCCIVDIGGRNDTGGQEVLYSCMLLVAAL